MLKKEYLVLVITICLLACQNYTVKSTDTTTNFTKIPTIANKRILFLGNSITYNGLLPQDKWNWGIVLEIS